MIKDLFEIILKFFKSRIVVLTIVCVGLFSILIYRVFNLQIVNSDRYSASYTESQEKTIYITGTRGNIYDADGKLLAYNEPVYSVTMEDILESGDTKSDELNRIINTTVRLIEKNGDTINSDFPLIIDAAGQIEFSTEISENTRLRFLKNIYGTEKLDTEKKKLSEASAREVFEYLRDDKYYIDDKLYTEAETLKIMTFRYNLSLNAYQKYISTTIATDVSQETVAAIYENSADIPGVKIVEDTKRVYNDAFYFAHIIGYTGKISDEQISTLNSQKEDKDDKYQMNDIVGKDGIESSMELTLSGHKGYQKVFVDNTGAIKAVSDSKDAKAGNDIYLTIKSDYQIGIYHLIEQRLAKILVANIVNHDLSEKEKEDWKIPIKDVYFQMINNNVVDLNLFNAEGSTENEKRVYSVMSQRKAAVVAEIRQELLNNQALALNKLSKEMNGYYTYIFNMLTDTNQAKPLIAKKELTESDKYTSWMRDDISLRDILMYCVSNNYVDISQLNLENDYADSETIYNALVTYIIDKINNSGKEFDKLIYQYLIDNGSITGSQVCLLLYDQKVLEFDQNMYNRLSSGSISAYDFMISQIKALKITPAQIALTPCSASVTLTDVNTGQVLAMVSYPSYDNNAFSGGINYDYWTELSEDLSSPLYSRATKMRTAPGSTFKPLSAIAGLEEKVITTSSTITCHGIFSTVTPSPKCWIYPGAHGSLSVSMAIRHSCNVFFYEVGYRLACKGGSYNEQKGLELLKKYGTMVGLTEKSGVEVEEYKPLFSTTNPITSAIGQGSHSFTGAQLARYVNTIAANGTNRELTLIKDIMTYDGKSLGGIKKETTQMDVSDESLAASRYGMQLAGESYTDLKATGYKVAAKSGTAQENANLPDHATLICYAPYDNPEVSMSVVIQNGYTSNHSIALAADVMKFYYGKYSLDQILAGNSDGPAVENPGAANPETENQNEEIHD